MKFRVWSHTYKRYFTDDFLIDSAGVLFENQRGQLINQNSNDWRVEYCSEFEDINGQAIYENDIVELQAEEELVQLDNKGLFEILFFNPPTLTQDGDVSLVLYTVEDGFHLTIEPETSIYAFRLKVVGNCNETPELKELCNEI